MENQNNIDVQSETMVTASFSCPMWLQRAMEKQIMGIVVSNSTDKLYDYSRSRLIIDALTNYYGFKQETEVEQQPEVQQ
ncbi:MAG: hypothetical protein ABI778_02030 [Ignavibacteriota bacterium]